jgi:hypothetical protein
MLTSRRAFVAGSLTLGAGLVVPRLAAEPRRPAITVYREPT